MRSRNIKGLKASLLQTTGLVIMGLFVTAFLTAAKPAAQKAGIETCAACHEETCTEFKLVRHASIQEDKWTEDAKQDDSVCANCHGDLAKHLEEGGGADTIFSFSSTPDIQGKTQKCLNCHFGTRSRYFASPHGRAGMDCTNCHDQLMSDSGPKKSPTKICLSCHEEVSAQFQLNERHRLQEGIMDCTTCHDQHAPSASGQLGGFKDRTCLRCHTDKSGPYLFEHGAMQVEGCTVCHESHGSPNRHMLTMQSVSDLCFSCHTQAISWHSRFNSTETNCTTCHSTIHGSNLSRIFLK